MSVRYLLEDIFIPNRKNNFAPRSLQKIAVFGMGTLALVTFSMTSVQSLVWPTSDWLVSTILPAVIVEETNSKRNRAALTELTRNPVLDRAAALKAEHMATHEYFSHYSPNGISPWYWFSEAGYTFFSAGENLAVFFTDSKAVVNAWMESPRHRENILNENYTEIGIGVASGEFHGHETVFVVQLFGRPANPVLSERVSANTSSSLLIGTSTNPAVAGVARVTGSMEHDTIVHQDGTVAMYGTHVATTLPGAPAPRTQSASSFYTLVTSPSVVLQAIYTMIGVFVFCALVLSIRRGIRRENARQLIYGISLLIFMAALFYIHIRLTTDVLIA